MRKLSLFFLILTLSFASFNSLAQDVVEIPMFEEKVAQGELPPMEERVPDDPYIVETIESIGDYGGTLQVATLGVESWGDHLTTYDFVNSLVKPNPEANDIIPNFAKKIEVSDEMDVYTFHLRKGVRWSDGKPFDADDIMFWYNDVLQNDELVTTAPAQFRAKGELMELEKIDDYTIKISFKDSQIFFLESLVHQSSMFTPKHYLKKYHPEYTSENELETRMEEEGFDAWYELFEYKNNTIMGFPLTEERPTLTAYHLTNKNSDNLILERNPYFWKVDEEGNQLPYIDKIYSTVMGNLEVVQGKILSGEIDFSSRHVDIRNYPMYRKYEEDGNFRTVLWQDPIGNHCLYQLNLTHEDPQLREIFQDKRFRQALSLAIDRDEINEMIYFGQAVPRQFTILPDSKYFEAEFAKAYTEYDPERAKQKLEDMGLEQDRNGYWLREDGKRISFTIEFTERPYPIVPNIEIVTAFWQDIGLEVSSQLISGELASQRAPANMMDAGIWSGGTTDILFPQNPDHFIPYSTAWSRTQWPKWDEWAESEGKRGEEPPEELKELYNTWVKVTSETNEEKRIEMIKEIVSSQAENVWVIGTIGLPPRPVIVNKNLKNVPEENLWAWDTLTGCHVDLEQMFFEDGKRASN